MKEIERKYLIKGNFREFVSESMPVSQGYISTDPERVVRIRTLGPKSYLTIKGRREGITRMEWEHEISNSDAKELLKICGRIIKKTRHIVKHKHHIFEIDEFHDKDDGLIIAELELEHENQVPDLPPWIGKEVSHDKKYYNSYLSKHPFCNWEKK